MASDPVHRGAKPPIDLPSVVKSDPREGRSEEYSARILRSARATTEATLVALGLAYEITPEGNSPCDIVRYWMRTKEDGTSAATEENISTTWSREPIQLSQSIWRNKYVQAELKKLEDLDLEQQNAGRVAPSAKLRMMIEGHLRNQVEIVDPDDEDGEPIPCKWSDIMTVIDAFGLGLNKVVFAKLIQSIARGQETELFSTHDLIKTREVGGASTFVHDITGENGMYTVAAFRSQENPPTTRWQFPVSGYYHKHPAQISQQSNGNWVVTQRWTWVEEFSILSYDLIA